MAVFDAAWNLLTANDLWTALVGDRFGGDRNVVRCHFLGGVDQVRQTPEDDAAFETATVADLRAAAARYPADAALRDLVAELRSGSPAFAARWESAVTGVHASSRKTVAHPEVGPMDLDCDILTVPGCDVRIVAYTAAPDSEAASRLALLEVVGAHR